MSDTPERISISPVHNRKRDDDYYLVDRKAFPDKGTEFVRADLYTALTAERDTLLVLVEMALSLQETGFTDFQKYGLSCDEDISKKYRAALKGKTDDQNDQENNRFS